MGGKPAGGEVALGELDDAGFIAGRAKEEQVAGAGAVGRAKAADAGLRVFAGPSRPRALQPVRILSGQRSQQAGVGQQVVDVPVLAACARCVAPKPRSQPARPQGAAGVAVQPWRKVNAPQPADLQPGPSGQRHQKEVRTRARGYHL